MKNTLQFKNGQFKIMSLGDLHEKVLVENRHDEKCIEDMHNLIKTGILAFKPDLIVLMGDTCCEQDNSEGFENYRTALDRILKPILDSGIPFAYVLGNHEHDAHQETEVTAAYNKYENCLAWNDTSAPRGNLNYNLTVKDSKGENNIFNLWFIDSNNLCEDKSLSVYDWVHTDQIEWQEKKTKEIADNNGGTVLPSVLFQHIPVAEEYELMREAKPYELPFSVKGHHKWEQFHYVLKDNVDGYLGEGPCAPAYDDGQFAGWKRSGDVCAAFFGHDHLNDFTGKVDGILLGQNKTSGFRTFTDGCQSLVRITTIDENDLRNVKSKVYHFKELGLECHCLGPIQKRITDRQSINLHYLSYAAAGLAGLVGAAKIIKKIKNK